MTRLWLVTTPALLVAVTVIVVTLLGLAGELR